MRTEYAVEVYNKYHDNFINQLDVFEAYEEAVEFIEKKDFDLDESSEYVGILEIEYDDNGEEVRAERM